MMGVPFRNRFGHVMNSTQNFNIKVDFVYGRENALNVIQVEMDDYQNHFNSYIAVIL